MMESHLFHIALAALLTVDLIVWIRWMWRRS